jgi:FkbM family methyltransferase
VFDVGSSYGVISALVAQLTGPHGRIYAFEANPEVLPTAEELLRTNQLSDRVQLMNVCIGEASGQEVEFHVVPGFKSVVSSRGHVIAECRAEARRIRVAMMALDDLCPSVISTPPDVIKIDVEGSEYCAIAGGRSLLSEHHPDLVIETHAPKIIGIGGSLEKLCQELAGLGYGLFDLKAGEPTTPEAYASRYGAELGQLLASGKLRRPEISGALSEKYRIKKLLNDQWNRLWQDFYAAGIYINTHQPLRALPLLRKLLVWKPQDPEARRLLDLALHAAGQELDEPP